MTFTNEAHQARVTEALNLIHDLTQTALDSNRPDVAGDLEYAYKIIDQANRELPVPPPFALLDLVRIRKAGPAYAVVAVKADGAVTIRPLNASDRNRDRHIAADDLHYLKAVPPHHQLNLTTGGARA